MIKKPASQTREWWVERNARRRKRYSNDPTYKALVNKTNRGSYRKVSPVATRIALKGSDLSAQGTIRRVHTLVGNQKMKTFSVEEMATVLGGYHTVVLYRWIRAERFPKPQLATVADGMASQMVYCFNDTRLIAKAFSKHQLEKSYFHSSDFATVAKLFDAVGQPIPKAAQTALAFIQSKSKPTNTDADTSKNKTKNQAAGQRRVSNQSRRTKGIRQSNK